jgi:hypothetical protein
MAAIRVADDCDVAAGGGYLRLFPRRLLAAAAALVAGP